MERDAASLGNASGIPVGVPFEKRGWRVPQAPFYARGRSFAYVIGFHLPMSSALCVCIHASETGHAEGVTIAPSRGRSVSFPILRELWLHM